MTPASDALKKKSNIILKRFEERARREVASTYGITSLSLRDSLPRHLEQLVSALAAVEKKSTEEIAEITVSKEGIGKIHGRDRATTIGYSMDELIFEYRILRQVVIQTLEEEVELSADEREIITDLIEQAVNDSAVEFMEVQREENEQFTAILSHDLRSPITAVKMSADLILRNPNNADSCRRNASRVIEGVVRMDGMIQDLLDSGRVKAGQPLSAKFGDCDPAVVAKEVIEQMALIHGDRFVLSGENGIRANWSCDLYKRALENLLNNAVKYGSENTKISVSVRREGELVKVVVHNEGNPIPEQEQSLLFQRHRRSKSAQSSETKGWGLGLTLVLGAVRAHGGTVSVESSEEKGTSFKLSMPIDAQLATAS